MESILLVAHGSRRNAANHMDAIAQLLRNALASDATPRRIQVAYLELAEPSIPEAIRDCIQKGATKIVIHPYFLSSGMHVTRDIPAIIAAAQRDNPDVEFVYTDPLGVHPKLAEIVLDRIQEAEVT